MNIYKYLCHIILYTRLSWICRLWCKRKVNNIRKLCITIDITLAKPQWTYISIYWLIQCVSSWTIFIVIICIYVSICASIFLMLTNHALLKQRMWLYIFTLFQVCKSLFNDSLFLFNCVASYTYAVIWGPLKLSDCIAMYVLQILKSFLTFSILVLI